MLFICRAEKDAVLAQSPRQVDSSIRVGVRTRSISKARLRFLRQLGVDGVYLEHSSVDEEPNEFIDNTSEHDTIVIDGDVIPTADG